MTGEALITYDRQSFMLNGKRLFLHSAAIHYFRFPQEEWRELLIKAKNAGINCIDTYFAWNVHEPAEGVWNFEGSADCEAFIKLCAELGFLMIARPGPYICAEWDFGGLPAWLSGKAGLVYRSDNDRFLHYTNLYFDKIVPIIARHQIDAGGNIILVQVENEYAHLGSDEQGRDYLNHLRDGLLGRGVTVPLISCEGAVEGAIECANFWSGGDYHYKKLSDKQPHAPKIVTEFWTGWFEHWGGSRATHKTPELLERRMVEMLQTGYSGFNHYMFCGGTNFGDYGGRTVGDSDIFMVTSYDYDAPVNEYLQLTDKYHAVKKIGYFIQGVHDFLLHSREIGTDLRMSEHARIRIRERESERIYFVESKRDERSVIAFTTDRGETYNVTVNPGQIVPVLENIQVTSRLRLDCNGFLAGSRKVDGMQTLLFVADPGQRTKVSLHGDQPIAPGDTNIVYSLDDCSITLDICHFDYPQVVHLQSGEETVRIVAINSEELKRTWWIEQGEEVGLLLGADDVRWDEEGKLHVGITGEEARLRLFGDKAIAGEEWVYEPEERWFIRTIAVQAGRGRIPALKLENWEAAIERMDAPTARANQDTPQGFAEAGQDWGYMLHSATVDSDEDREAILALCDVQDPVKAVVNGRSAGLIRNLGSSNVKLRLQKGANQIQLITQSMGRYNFSHYLGESKGINGPAYLDAEVESMLRHWSLEDGTPVHLDECNTGELDSAIISKSFNSNGRDKFLLEGMIGDALWINGKQVPLGSYKSWYQTITLDISGYVQPGQNVITMKYYKSPISRLELYKMNQCSQIRNWSSGTFASYDTEKTWGPGTTSPNGKPTWHRASFEKATLPEGLEAKLKLRLQGLSKGSIWLNGHPLGRYWQIGPQEYYKIPTAWLAERNQLVLFDEDGKSPSKIELLWDGVIGYADVSVCGRRDPVLLQ